MLFKLHLHDEQGSLEDRSFIAYAENTASAGKLADALGKQFFPNPRISVEEIEEHEVETLRHDLRYGKSVICVQWRLRRPGGAIESGFDIYTNRLENPAFWRGREFPPDLEKAAQERLEETSLRVINGHGAEFFLGFANKITEGVRIEDGNVVYDNLRSTIFAQ